MVSCRVKPALWSTVSCRQVRLRLPPLVPSTVVAKFEMSRYGLTSYTMNQDGKGLTWKDPGVNVNADTKLVCRIARRSHGIGGLAGDPFTVDDSYPYNYLVSSTDGVDMLKLAFETGIHDTIGINLVAMSVNDLITCGAKPLRFQYFLAGHHLDVNLIEKIMKGIDNGCRRSDCCAVGGEKVEMPHYFAKGEYQLVGSAVGDVKTDSVIDGKNIVAGDILIGLRSSGGVHTNGLVLVKRVLAESGLSLSDQLPGSNGKLITIAETLMAPPVIYAKQVLDIISEGGVNGMAHISGSGFTNKISHVLPDGLGAKIFTGSWEIPPFFHWLQQVGGIEDAEMRSTFHMGIGMVLVVTRESAERILAESSLVACHIGEVVHGEGVHFS
ncbi:Phosphoribosylformylglycinamidine cyclo-ligase [Rhynchospora pubera]|uniref:phosphoribosylformylglycinamidine cyclo-ligase n=1 Tax=Rhynchospora pubera TaxID=906938 RepID=A0AAV8CT21_9POAL|nr:Phosphoribosylformylglycinamidine cyclo-ligase [Rhynchospora pubera]